MSYVEEYANLLIAETGLDPETLSWKMSDGFVFGIDIFIKETGKRIVHTHASFPQTEDKEILAKEMIKIFHNIRSRNYEEVEDLD